MNNFRGTIFAGLAVLFVSSPAFAESNTWLANPIDNNWNNPANWSFGVIPNVGQPCVLGNSTITALEVTDYSAAGTLSFPPGASAYTITYTLNPANPNFFIFNGGLGIDNQSGIIQNFVLPAPVNANGDGAEITFDAGSAGSLTNFTSEPNPVPGGRAAGVGFLFRATAGSATFHNLGGNVAGGAGGTTGFAYAGCSAENSTIINEGGTVAGAYGAQSLLEFGTPTAGNATLIANGGTNGAGGGSFVFLPDAIGGTARFELFGNGYLDISQTKKGGFRTGSIEGDGQVYLGTQNLFIGSNNLSTTFAGVIHPGGPDGSTGKGVLTKIGTGTLTLSGANLYTDGTTVSEGSLRLNNEIGSGTGSGSVLVSAGTLGGHGIIAGPVTVGTGSGAGAFLTPAKGARHPVTLTLQGSLTFKADGTYEYKLSTRRVKADQVIANGVTIESGAQFNLHAVANRKLHVGQVFTAISNTSADPISGTFANLPDDSTVTIGNNTFQADYQGGDGNDLTLTVVQ